MVLVRIVKLVSFNLMIKGLVLSQHVLQVKEKLILEHAWIALSTRMERHTGHGVQLKYA